MDEFCAKQLVNVEFTSDEEEAKFVDCLDYFQGGYDEEQKFADLDKALAAREAPGADRLFFLSVPPTVFGDVCTMINNQARAAAPGKTQVTPNPLASRPGHESPLTVAADGRCLWRSRSAETRAPLRSSTP